MAAQWTGVLKESDVSVTGRGITGIVLSLGRFSKVTVSSDPREDIVHHSTSGLG